MTRQHRFLQAEKEVPKFIFLPTATSTNTVLREWWEDAEDKSVWPHLSTVVTQNQTQGRGRLGRSWVDVPDKALAVSTLVLLPDTPRFRGAIGWLALVTGLALRRVVQGLRPQETNLHDKWQAEVKWPNDVLLNGKKLAGILGEVLPGATDSMAFILGTGINLSLEPAELPVPHATSLRIAGMQQIDPDQVLTEYLRTLRQELDKFIAAEGDISQTDFLDQLRSVCCTLGDSVRITGPDGKLITGQAVDISGAGELIVDCEGAGLRNITAGELHYF